MNLRTTKLGKALRHLKHLRGHTLVDGVYEGPVQYNNDCFATRHHADFMQDERFLKAYALGRATGSWRAGEDLWWRCWIACWAAVQGAAIEGDFVEAGVNRGGMSRMIIDYIQFQKLPKKFYLMDTFAGIPDEQITEEERALGRTENFNEYSECYADVQKTFALFPNVVLIRGMIPQTLAQVPSERIAYLSLDMNLVEPERDAAEFFWPKMTTGGVMLLDDYGWNRHKPQKVMFDEFARDRGLQVMHLPNGQGILIKP